MRGDWRSRPGRKFANDSVGVPPSINGTDAESLHGTLPCLRIGALTPKWGGLDAFDATARNVILH